MHPCELLSTLQASGQAAVLATRLDGPVPGGGSLLVVGQGPLAGAAAAVLAADRPRLVLDEGTGSQYLLEPLDPRRPAPWLAFSALLLGRGKGCVLATVVGVAGDLASAIGDRFAYDDRGHGLLPMSARVSLELHRACARAREAGIAARITLPLANGSLDLLLEPLSLPPVPVVLLAAGASRRLGQPKQLVLVAGEPLLRRMARIALAGGGPVLVVLGCQAEAMAAALEGLPLTLVANPEWQEGMAASLRAGVRALPPGASGALLMVCDQLAVAAPLLAGLQAAHRAAPEAVVACGYGGTRGIPAILPARCFPELLALTGDRGGRSLLQGGDVVVLPFPEGERDLDRPEDLAVL
jgi:molybdenum cofactor cytidylyltransferase